MNAGRDSGWGCLQSEKLGEGLKCLSTNIIGERLVDSRAFDHKVINGPGAAGRGREAVASLYLSDYLCRWYLKVNVAYNIMLNSIVP